MHFESAHMHMPAGAAFVASDDLHHRRFAHQHSVCARHAVADHVVDHRRCAEAADLFVI